MTIPITGQPPVPDLSDPATFNTKALNLFTWITGSMLDQFNNVDPNDFFGASQITPPGMVNYFLRSTAPLGWLKLNGATISRTTYADLYAAISPWCGPGDGSTTFTLPDYRGEFLRAHDDGRGVDAGRTLASVQGQLVQAHTHSINLTTASAGAHAHTYANGGGVGSGYASLTNAKGSDTPTSTAGAHQHNISGYSDSTGGGETRPRNVALALMIKY